MTTSHYAFITTFVVMLALEPAQAQSILNGSFENNTMTVGSDAINLSNAGFNGYMADAFGFGDWNGGGDPGGDLDIISTATYCGLAQQGTWYVALTSGGSDAFSLTLSAAMVAGSTHTLHFFDRACSGYTPAPVEVGLSDQPNSFGTLIYTAPLPAPGDWNEHITTFTAPITGQYLTVRCGDVNGGSLWTQVDHFYFAGASDAIDEADMSTWHIYPQPSSGTIFVEGVPRDVGRIDVMDMRGRVTMSVVPHGAITKLDVAGLASGLYFMRTDRGGQVRRIVVD